MDKFNESIKKYSSFNGYDSLSSYTSKLNNGWYDDADYALSNMFYPVYDYDTKTYSVLKIVEKIYEDLYGKPLGIETISNAEYGGIKALLQKAKDDFLKSLGAKAYFRNEVDLFTSSGNRRSPDKLLTEATLQNIIKVMRAKGNLVGEEGNFDYGLKQRKALLNNSAT